MALRYRPSGSGEPIVLVPNGLTGCAGWGPIEERLAATRRVISVQLMNVDHGLRGEPLPPGYTLRTETDELAGALDEAAPGGPVDLVGWSTGGAVALDLGLERPERVRTLTLIEPSAFWVLGPTQDPWLVRLQRLADSMSGEVTEEQLAEFIGMASVAPTGARPPELERWPVWVRHRRSLLGMRAELAFRDDPGRLEGLRAPVLLVKGTGSVPVLHAVVDEVARRAPGCEVVELPAGHAPHLLSVDAFMGRMGEFQERRGGPRSVRL